MPLEFGAVGPPWWDDRPVAVVGAGPSLKGFNFDRLRGPWHVLAVNQKVWDLPFACAGFSLDLPWMQHQAEPLGTLTVPLWLAVPETEHVPSIAGATYLRRIRVSNRLSTDPTRIESGGTSGFGAFNFAVLKRAKKIVLFGFDYSDQGVGHDKPEQYPWHKKFQNVSLWPRWATNFRDTVPQLGGVTVLNASPVSSIDAFPKCEIEEAMRALLWRDAA